MLVAYLWSHWQGEPDLLPFAAITDEPPMEIAADGHDRCIIPIKSENVDAWLNPDRKNLAAQYAILDDRERPYYEHRLAAEAIGRGESPCLFGSVLRTGPALSDELNRFFHVYL
jgi:putative SOS response-associated peptidase YedK